MYYSCLQLTCNSDFAELLIAELGECGFDSFLETESGFEAYAEGENFDRSKVEALIEKYRLMTSLEFSFKRIEKQNWNEDWEKNYQPIVVEDTCLIRADFHRIDRKFPFELIITPKMSFGTGHHETTYLMIKNQMTIDHRGKRVMDAGCGTAILSVMASKLGASEVEAFDIDEWSVSNGGENIAVNGCVNIRHQQGKLSELSFAGKFDIILANINKNVLLEELSLYATYLKENGILLISGFYVNDIPDMLRAASFVKLSEVKRDEKENWASLKLTWNNNASKRLD
jgi:ribosomal protein L11 methyltransferase